VDEEWLMTYSSSVVSLQAKQKTELEALARSSKTPQKLARRARALLELGAGAKKAETARKHEVSRPTLNAWIARFRASGVNGILKDAPRPGRKKVITDSQIQAVLEATLQSKPEDATHWSTRTMAKKQGLSKMAIQRIWKTHGLQPHRVETFKLSRDKHFVEKLRDVVGLYLSPPEKALVLSVDEKSQIQALDRTQPGLPMKKGRCETMTHDYKRHGTTTLFAALNMLDGTVIGECMPRHRSREFIRFLKTIDAKTPKKLSLHLIVDNYCTHKSPPVKRWLKKNPRFHLHFIPTSSSWLNMVERWFGEITRKRIRRGVFQSVRDLKIAIQSYLDSHNRDPKIFTWTKDADTILAKVTRSKEALGALH
jgi:transposase